MIVPLNWLKEYIDITESPEEVARVFTSIGYMLDRPITQVEAVSYTHLDVYKRQRHDASYCKRGTVSHFWPFAILQR